MLKGTIALVIRYILVIGGGALAGMGIVTTTADVGFYCFDSKHVADVLATGIAMLATGGVSTAIGVGWRFWAKRKGGVT